MIEDLIRGVLSDNFTIGGYIFDAYLKMTQVNKLTVTEHPVMTGASVTDHAYINPVEFEFDIGVSDTSLGKNPLDFGSGRFGFSKVGFGTSRPVKAFKTLLEMQLLRQPVDLHCKYGDYKVLIDSITPVDDYTTESALRVTVHMREILITEATSVKTTESRSITDSTSKGQQTSRPLESNLSIKGGFGLF